MEAVEAVRWHQLFAHHHGDKGSYPRSLLPLEEIQRPQKREIPDPIITIMVKECEGRLPRTKHEGNKS